MGELVTTHGNSKALSAALWSPKTYTELKEFAQDISKSSMVPSSYKDKPGDIVVAMVRGAEVGFSPLASLDAFCIINGKACLYGDAPLALVQSSGLMEWHKEYDDGATWTFEAKRKGDPNPVVSKFSIEDAKKAGLWGKAGPWTNYPPRMLKFRARGFGLRDKFADALKGIAIAEEVADYEVIAKVDEKTEIVAPRRASDNPATAQTSAPIIAEEAAKNAAPTAAAEQVADFTPSKVTKAGEDFRIYDKDELYTTKDAGLAAIAKAAKEHNKPVRVTFVMEAGEGKIKTLALLEGAAA